MVPSQLVLDSEMGKLFKFGEEEKKEERGVVQPKCLSLTSFCPLVCPSTFGIEYILFHYTPTVLIFLLHITLNVYT